MTITQLPSAVILSVFVKQLWFFVSHMAAMHVAFWVARGQFALHFVMRYCLVRTLVSANGQTRDFPLYQGNRVSPSGRFSSDRHKPCGFFELKISAADSARATRSFKAWWRIDLPRAFLQTICGSRMRPLEPRGGIDVGHKSPDQFEASLQPVLLRHPASCHMTPVSYTHLTLPTKRIV